jgi:hypothetical protein
MQYFKTKEISVYNFGMLTENGLDLSFLLKKPAKLTKKRTNKLYDAYLGIINSLEGMNTELMQAHLKWKASFISHRAGMLIRTKEAVAKLEADVRNYLELVSKSYKDFEIKEYYFNPEWREVMNVFKEKFTDELYNDIYLKLKQFERIRFYTWDEYYIFCMQYPEMLALTLNEQFKRYMILNRIIKVQNLVEVDTYLLDVYSENGLYNEYQEIRWNLFNLEKLKCEAKELSSFFKEVAIVQSLTFPFDTKTTTMFEYEKIKEVAKQKAEESKPQADDLKQRQDGRI